MYRRILGARLEEVKMTYESGFRLDADSFAGAISKDTRMVVLTNSNNPTGLKITRGDSRKNRGGCRKEGISCFRG